MFLQNDIFDVGAQMFFLYSGDRRVSKMDHVLKRFKLKFKLLCERVLNDLVFVTEFKTSKNE